MSAAVSQIAFKGFMLGYLHKTAENMQGTNTPKSPTDPTTAITEPQTPEGPAEPPKKEKKKETPPATPTPYGDLGGQLAKLWPGAAIGAAGVGGASLGIDAMRDKPMNVKRAILLSLLMGVPLGAAGQMGVMGGTDAYKQFGGNVAAASKQGLKDILRKGKGGIGA